MLNGTLLFSLAAVGCAVTFQADAGPTGRNQNKPDGTNQPPAQVSNFTSSTSDPIFVDWAYTSTEPLRHENGSYRFPANPGTSNPNTLLRRFNYASKNTYVPMPQPEGQYGPGFSGWMSWFALASAEHVAEAGAPVTVLLRERNAPFPYRADGHSTSPDALRHTLNSLPKLDYLFMDLEFESDKIEQNVREVIRMVRNHPNPKIANAYIGNYNDFPGQQDNSRIWTRDRDRTALEGGQWNRSALYDAGLNVAMPIAYPYESYSRHTNAWVQGGEANTTPNDRAAMLWAPVEQVSVAARALPEGHKLVPWVSNFVKYLHADPNDVYNAPPPPPEDARALIQHIRLRGANGYVLWTSNTDQTYHPTMNYEQYRALALDAWADLDPAFDQSDDRVQILNLSTDKHSGIVWSGVRSGDKVTVLVSNLSGNERPAVIRLPNIEGLPDTTDPVPNSAHRLFVYEISSNATASQEDRSDDPAAVPPAASTPGEQNDGSGATTAVAAEQSSTKQRRVFRSSRMMKRK